MKKHVAFIVLCLGISFVLSRIAGALYYDPRPFVVGHFTPAIPHAADNGFPSDHALLFGTLAAILLYYDKRYSAVLWIGTAAISLVRVRAGIHHPIDILGSVAIALLASCFAHAIIGRLWKRPRTNS